MDCLRNVLGLCTNLSAPFVFFFRFAVTFFEKKLKKKMSNKNKICLKTTNKARRSFVSYSHLWNLKEYSAQYYAFHVTKYLNQLKGLKIKQLMKVLVTDI